MNVIKNGKMSVSLTDKYLTVIFGTSVPPIDNHEELHDHFKDSVFKVINHKLWWVSIGGLKPTCVRYSDRVCSGDSIWVSPQE